MRGRLRRWVARGVIALLAASLVPLWAGVAHAAIDDTDEAAREIVVPGNRGKVHFTVDCPGDKQALSGGFISPVGIQVVSRFYVTISRPTPTGFGWEFEAINLDFDPHLFVGRVICANITGWTFTTAEISLPVQDTNSGIARCPTRWVNVGGGYESRGGSFVWIRTSRPVIDGEGWLVTGYGSGTTTTFSVVAYAVCGRVTHRSSIQETRNVAPATTIKVLATCPGGMVTTGGGWSVGSNEGWPPFTSMRLGLRTWGALFFNPNPAGPSIPVTTRADCVQLSA